MFFRNISLVFTLFFSSVILLSCKDSKQSDAKDALFTLMPSSATGINFTNTVTDSNNMNILNYHNFYNGGGVAIGDINNDGLPDVFLSSNQGENKLYLNKANLQFEDISDKAGIRSAHTWHTGVSMVDINADGWLDIYVCNAGIKNNDDRSNELFINQKNGTFKEQAAAYGLNDKGASTQAIFFDFDHDNDLDCFVLNNSPKSIDNFGYKSDIRYTRDSINGDRLYRNDQGKFKDISAQAGIYGSEIAFGLGVAVGDLNNDGWEDLYIANDFFEHDYLYINQQNGSFKERSNEAMGHMSNGAMGTDMADINNDGYLDIFTAEMLPENDYRLKTTIKFDGYDMANARNQLNFHHQFTANTLQLNNQNGTFSEIAQLAGIDATGWSWGTLCFDFDNDGWKDIFVCNGIRRDLTNQDFLAFFNSQENLAKVRQGGFDFLELLNKMPSVPIPNFAFKNQGNLLFKDASAPLGFALPTFSSGAAYADLDGDGDLDLIINNENLEASLYRNNSTQQLKHHFLKVKTKGTAPNTMGYGARVTVYADTMQQMLEQMPVRGFQSSVDPVMVFGLANRSHLDSVVIQWPNQKTQTLTNVKADTLLVLMQEAAQMPTKPASKKAALYEEVADLIVKGNILHKENDFVDFDVERLIPKMLSTEAPKLATGDLNGDGWEDFFVGASTGDASKIFLQKANGTFEQKVQPVFQSEIYFETTGVAFFDADGDKDLDLVAVSGGNENKIGSPYLSARLYYNDGNANFSPATNSWPGLSINASCVRVGDFDHDGLEDIFIGARNIPGSYGIKPSSILLKNNAKGMFIDVTASLAPVLMNAGMVTDAQWADIDKDGKKELVVVGDWMPVTVFKWENNKLQKSFEIDHSAGWWNCLTVADLDGNGTMDLVAGNFGLNSNIKADKEHPAKLFVNDFDNNGQTECIPVYFKNDGKAYPYFLKDELESQLPVLKKKFLKYESYAGKPIEEIFDESLLQKNPVLTVEQTQTCIFMNDGKGNFTMKELPIMAQLSPVFGITVTDLNNDAKKDLFLVGNFYGLKPQTGRLDASYGTTLLNTGNGRYHFSNPNSTGLFVNGEVRDAKLIRSAKGKDLILVSLNNSPLRLFKKKE